MEPFNLRSSPSVGVLYYAAADLAAPCALLSGKRKM
jgi:hypothetical protein